MTEQLAEPTDVLDTWDEERELLAHSLLPETLEGVRCDVCGSAGQSMALHAWIIGGDLLAMCNHHGRQFAQELRDHPHRDYRMPLAEAEKLDAEGRARALASANEKKPTTHTASAMERAANETRDDYRPIPRHTVQWDLHLKHWAGYEIREAL